MIKALGAPLKSVKNLLGTLAAIIILAGLFIAYQIFGSYSIGPDTKSILVEKNVSFSQVTDQLIEQGVLKSRFYFKKLAVILNIDKKLMRGRYDFSDDVSVYSILQKLKARDIAMIKLTIPEGFIIPKIAGKTARELDLDSARFHNLCNDKNYLKAKYGRDLIEGYLFPETYILPYGLTEEEIIDALYEQYKTESAQLFDGSNHNNLSDDETMVLASIIEAEAMYADEMPTISSVYHNRLKKRMRLQADPTVIYALGGLDRPLWYRDLKIDSPYNTYKYKGLPPGPINSPGRDAIKAALNPANTDYLYFVADKTGRHVFTKTLREHNNAKKRIKNSK